MKETESVKEENGEEENHVPIVDLKEMNKKHFISNSQMILCILEICLNASHYGIKYSNRTRIFWDEVYNKKEWHNILKAFKPETLRKYWRTLNDLDNPTKIVEVVNQHADEMNIQDIR